MSDLFQEWEQRLKKEGLGMRRGAPSWLSYVKNTDVVQRGTDGQERDIARPINSTGGRLSEYKLGEKTPAIEKRPRQKTVKCSQCPAEFVSSPKRGFPSSYCSPRCRKRAQRPSRLSPATNGETNNAASE